MFHIFGALAELERDLSRERTIAGLQAARARGQKGGAETGDVEFGHQKGGCYVTRFLNYED